MSKTLSIIGGGNVGKSLGRLWAMNRSFAVQDVMSSSLDSARHAVAFIGAGRAVAGYEDLRPSDIYMIATPDDRISEACDRLARTDLLSPESIVFHCSGALSSMELQSARGRGASIASIHPIRSFAAPDRVVEDFPGTCCGVEGDQGALEVLAEGFAAIGAQLVQIHADSKILYHAGSVFACNYLTTLLGLAQEAYIKAGVPSDIALKLMEPLVRETVDNIFRAGPAAALTGPIARGDMRTASRQCHAVTEWDARYGGLYADFIELTAELAQKKREPKD